MPASDRDFPRRPSSRRICDRKHLLKLRDSPQLSQRHDTRRRFEQWAKNPDCEANTVSAVAGVSMADVAKTEDLEPTMGQSPYALMRGNTFERALFAKDAARLRDALVEADVLAPATTGFLDLRLSMNGGRLKTHTEAITKTRELLQRASAVGPKGLQKLPTIVASPTLQLPGQPVMLPEGHVAIDGLVLRPELDGDRVELVIGEIKTYPDRAGYTDPADLATSRAQAGVYLHALRLIIAELDLTDRLVACSHGFLVLTRTGRNDPSVRAGEDLEFQARRAERGFARLRHAALKLTPFDENDTEKGIAAVKAGETAYRPGCLDFCDRAAGCRKAAEEAGDPAVLGEDVKRFLGATRLPRALELLRGAEPVNDTERELAERLKTAVANP